MSIRWDERNKRWRYEFRQTIADRRYRFSRLLPRGWSETQARRFDQQETARTYARLSAGVTAGVPLIDSVVALYLKERIPVLRNGKNAARNLAHLLDHYQGKTLDRLGEIAREYAKTDLAPATVRQRLATLRSAASYALKYHDLGSADWIARMPMPSVKNERHIYLTRKQVVLLARACKHPGARALILMTFGTGSRPGELHRSEPLEGGLLLPEDKAGNRVFKPVPGRLRRYLRHWPMPLDYTRYSLHFRAARKAVGLPHIHLHDLRHSTASAIISSGGTLAEAGAVLDHQTAQSTKRYAHLYDSRKREILERLWHSQPHKSGDGEENQSVKAVSRKL